MAYAGAAGLRAVRSHSHTISAAIHTPSSKPGSSSPHIAGMPPRTGSERRRAHTSSTHIHHNPTSLKDITASILC
jgi:hypothetical protein